MSQLHLSIATTDYDHLALYTCQQGIAHSQFNREQISPAGTMTKVVI